MPNELSRYLPSSCRQAVRAVAGDAAHHAQQLDQGRHLHGTLRGHCEADLDIGSDGTAIVVAVNDTGSRGVLGRVDAWLSEFGVASAALERTAGKYEMTKSLERKV